MAKSSRRMVIRATYAAKRSSGGNQRRNFIWRTMVVLMPEFYVGSVCSALSIFRVALKVLESAQVHLEGAPMPSLRHFLLRTALVSFVLLLASTAARDQSNMARDGNWLITQGKIDKLDHLTGFSEGMHLCSEFSTQAMPTP